MPTYTVHEAKTHLSKLIERAERGEEVIIARGDKPVVKVTAIENKPKPKRQPGMLKGLIHIPDSFFDPMTEEELRLIEEGHEGDPLRLPLDGKADEGSS
jgi:prevent-host-death family protein